MQVHTEMASVLEKGSEVKPVALALQGGGSHGAFAWGVLDKLAEDGRLSIDAISATSAGAMNAAAFSHGFVLDGFDGARLKMHEFWRQISMIGSLHSPMPWQAWLQSGCFKDVLPTSFAFQMLTQLCSPYQLNPFNYNPLRDVLAESIDFELLRANPIAPRLFVSATNVRTGKIKVFDNTEISPDVILASACLPYVFQAVEIAGEHYWDGGFMGNPAIFPLIYNRGAKDVVIVHIDPIERDKLPVTPTEIFNRMNEITFNSSLMREMRAVAFVTQLIESKILDPADYSRMLIHSIRDDVAMAEFGAATKFDCNWDFLCRLRDAGRDVAARWLEENFDNLGRASTVDLTKLFL